MIEEGKPAPDFELASDAGERVRLSSLRGKPVVLYFYPKDDTPGCTAQACAIRDAWGDVRGRAERSCSASAPTARTRTRSSRRKYGLPFTLLADPDHAVAERYGVWVREDAVDGKTYMGIERSTFVIAPGRDRGQRDAQGRSDRRTRTTCSTCCPLRKTLVETRKGTVWVGRSRRGAPTKVESMTPFRALLIVLGLLALAVPAAATSADHMWMGFQDDPALRWRHT